MASFIRRNLVAFVALFIAILTLGTTSAYAINSIRSSDIVDGQVQNADLAANAVGNGKIQDGSVLGADIKDNALSGLDIKESTLGQVPNAKKLDGIALGELRHRTITASQLTHECIPQVNLNSPCAPVSVTVPTGHTYVVTVTSEVTALAGPALSILFYCPAVSGRTCINEDIEVFSLPANNFTNASTTATGHYGPGTYTFSTTERSPDLLTPNGGTHTATTVEFYDDRADSVDNP